MKPGDRVKVTTAYGEKFPLWDKYVGCEGTVDDDQPTERGWDAYVSVRLDADDGSGLFLRDEIELI